MRALSISLFTNFLPPHHTAEKATARPPTTACPAPALPIRWCPANSRLALHSGQLRSSVPWPPVPCQALLGRTPACPHPIWPTSPAPPISAVCHPTISLLPTLARWCYGRCHHIRPLLGCAPTRPCHGRQRTIQPLLGCASTCPCPIRPLLDHTTQSTPAQSHEDELIRLFPRTGLPRIYVEY